MRIRRDSDPYRIPRDLEWIAAAVAALLVVGLLLYLALVNLPIWD